MDQHNGIRTHGLFPSDGSDPFARLGLHVHGIRGKIQQFRQPLFDDRLVDGQFWALSMNRAVEVHRLPALLPQASQGFCQEPRGIGPRILRIGVREQFANVAQSRGSQQGIGHGVQQDIRVAVAIQTGGMLDTDPAQNQRPARQQLLSARCHGRPPTPSKFRGLMRQATAKALFSEYVSESLMRHNAPTGVTAGVNELDLVGVSEGFQGSLDGPARAANTLHDHRYGGLLC